MLHSLGRVIPSISQCLRRNLDRVLRSEEFPSFEGFSTPRFSRCTFQKFLHAFPMFRIVPDCSPMFHDVPLNFSICQSRSPQTCGVETLKIVESIGAFLTPKIYSMHRVFFEFPSSFFIEGATYKIYSKETRCFELILGVRNAAYFFFAKFRK